MRVIRSKVRMDPAAPIVLAGPAQRLADLIAKTLVPPLSPRDGVGVTVLAVHEIVMKKHLPTGTLRRGDDRFLLRKALRAVLASGRMLGGGDLFLPAETCLENFEAEYDRWGREEFLPAIRRLRDPGDLVLDDPREYVLCRLFEAIDSASAAPVAPSAAAALERAYRSASSQLREGDPRRRGWEHVGVGVGDVLDLVSALPSWDLSFLFRADDGQLRVGNDKDLRDVLAPVFPREGRSAYDTHMVTGFDPDELPDTGLGPDEIAEIRNARDTEAERRPDLALLGEAADRALEDGTAARVHRFADRISAVREALTKATQPALRGAILHAGLRRAGIRGATRGIIARRMGVTSRQVEGQEAAAIAILSSSGLAPD